MINPNTDIVQLMMADILKWITDLENFLKEHNIVIENSSLSKVIEEVKKLKTRKVTENYAGVITDTHGYIIKAYVMKDFFKLSELPKDISSGYYYIQDGKITLDEERQRQIEEV